MSARTLWTLAPLTFSLKQQDPQHPRYSQALLLWRRVPRKTEGACTELIRFSSFEVRTRSAGSGAEYLHIR